MAIYNPYFQPQVGSYNQSPTQIPQQPPKMVVNYAQGLSSAKVFPLAPNTVGFFLDTEGDYIFIKETDGTGYPKYIRIIRCNEITEEEYGLPHVQNTLPDNIVTADKLESFIQNYLDTHSYRPYIPRSERNKNE